MGAEVSKALNPAQQVLKIVNDELVTILGGETRRLRFAKQPPTVIMLAGLQGAGKTTLAGKLGRWLKEQGHSPLLVACTIMAIPDGRLDWTLLFATASKVAGDQQLLEPGPDLDARRRAFHQELLSILEDIDDVESIANEQFKAREPGTRNTFRRPSPRR